MFDLTPDLCDAYADRVRLLPLSLKHYGGKPLFWGEVVTVRCFEDNSRVKELLATSGKGKVLLVDGGGSVNRALLGDMIAASAVTQGWSGAVINGAVRDAGELSQMPLGVMALGTTPFKTKRLGAGEQGVALQLGGVVVKPGSWLYADLNGVLVSESELPLSDDIQQP